MIRIRRSAAINSPDVRSRVPPPPGGGGRAQTRPLRPAGAGTEAAARAGTAQAPALLPELQNKKKTLLLGSLAYSQLLFRCCYSQGRRPPRDYCGLLRHRWKFSMVRRVLRQLAGGKKENKRFLPQCDAEGNDSQGYCTISRKLSNSADHIPSLKLVTNFSRVRYWERRSKTES